MRAVVAVVLGLFATACEPVVGDPIPDGGADAGSRSDAGPVGPPDGGDVPAVCSSGTYWLDGDEGSEHMHPGHACIACHVTTGDDGLPDLSIVGTVFPTLHEPDDCNGTDQAVIEITDAEGQVLTLTPNSAGNFLSTVLVKYPIRAKIKANGLERVMTTKQNTGDCNSCHTQAGTSGAEGRIRLP